MSLFSLSSFRLLAPLALALGALSASAEDAPKAPPKDAPKEVRLGYFANLTHAQAVLGVESGAFAKAVAPAKFDTKVFNAGPSLIEALFAGEIDIGYVGPGPAINAWSKSKGQGIRVISGAAANGVIIVAGPNSGIKTLADLKGKKIATPQLGNTQDIAAKWYVKNVLKQDDTDNIIPIPNAEQANLLKRGDIDAAWSPEPWATRLIKEGGATAIAEEKDLWKSADNSGEFSLTLVVTTPEFLAAHPETVRAFLAEHQRLTAELVKDPAKQVNALANGISRASGKSISRVLVAEALPHVKFTCDPLAATLAVQAQWAFDTKVLKDKVKLEGFVVPVPEAGK